MKPASHYAGLVAEERERRRRDAEAASDVELAALEAAVEAAVARAKERGLELPTHVDHEGPLNDVSVERLRALGYGDLSEVPSAERGGKAVRVSLASPASEGDPRLARTVESLDLSVRSENGLKRSGIDHVGALVLRSRRDLIEADRLINRKSIRKIEETLGALGLSLSETDFEDGAGAARAAAVVAGGPGVAASSARTGTGRVTTVAELGLSARWTAGLRLAGVETIDALTSMSEMELYKLRFMGRRSVKEVKGALARCGLALGSGTGPR